MKRKKVIIVLVCLLFVMAIGGIVIHNRSRRSVEDRRTFVQTATLNKRTVMNTLSLTGTVESATSETVTSSLNDVTVQKVNVQIGDEVKAGDVICVFDASDLEDSLADAQTNLNVSRTKAKNEVESAKEALENTKTSAAVSMARAEDSAAEANSAYSEALEKSNQAYKEYEKAAQKEADLKEKTSACKRSLKGAREGLANLKETLSQVQKEEEKAKVQADIEEKSKEVESLKKEYEDTKKSYEDAGKNTEEKLAAYEAAKKEADNAKSSYKKAVWEKEDTERNSAENISGKEDNLENSQLNTINSSSNEENQVKELKEKIEGCTIKAPVDGIVTSLWVEEGGAFSGGEVVTVQDNDSFIVSADVDEYDIADVEKGMRVVVKTDATGDDELEGEVTFVSPTPADNSAVQGNSSSESGYPVEIKLNTKSDRLRIGMTAKASIVLEESADVFAVPYDAIHTNAAGESIIFIKEQGGKRETENKEITVTLGLESDYYTEIASDQLTEGMEVILNEQNNSGETNAEEKGKEEGGMFGGFGDSPGGRGDRGGGSGGAPGGAPSGMPGGF
ncbi:MAG: efflux RND transporter periplasmic adaptor subunit [Roseburia sp.]|nr:efflux RND transporter periplasmic adaptor subunit [Roseburia sp.]MCM1279414.1 efflux RND transporter periplasmic adaptor subunit [Robinsoniella sp.]